MRELERTIDHVMTSPQDDELVKIDAVNRRGRSFECEIRCTALVDAEGQIRGAILLMQPVAPVADRPL